MFDEQLDPDVRSLAGKVLLNALQTPCAMDSVTRNIVMHVLSRKGPIWEAAQLEGINVQAAHARVKKAGVTIPAIGRLGLVKARRRDV